MLISDYSNSEEILATTGQSRALVWKSETVDFLKLENVAIVPDGTPVVEFHLYTPNGDKLLTSSVITDNFRYKQDEIYIDYAAELVRLNIERGFFRSVVNIQRII